MFGLQFPVSAGRCTRGIYAQFVPVEKTKSEFSFDYAMILDTEGLRAPELAGEYLFHDNELATFVIGLGDTVIVNIKGEAIADMENILQIVVHAFLRLKQANKDIDLRQSAIFVHQNVNATNAREKIFQGTKNTVDNLNKMTKEVALQEQIFNIEAFNDIIHFDPLHHIKYIPDLLRGTSQMAPVNPAYSKSVKDTAKCLFQEVLRKNKTCLSMSNIFLHVQSLWKAILTEDFVFSFRNALEVKAYKVLDAQYQKLAYELEGLKLDWSINNVGPRLGMCKDEKAIEACANELRIEFAKQLTEKQQEVTNDLRNFSDASDMKDQMINWTEQKCLGLDATVSHLLIDFRSRIDQEVKKCKNKIESNKELLKQESVINKKAVELAEQLRGETPCETTINKIFEKHWMEWIEKFTSEISPESSEEIARNLEMTMKNHICDKFQALKHFFIREKDIDYLNMNWDFQVLEGSFVETMVDKEDISKLKQHENQGFRHKFTEWKRKFLSKSKDNRTLVVERVNYILSDVDDILENQLRRDSLYEEQQFSHILKCVKDQLDDFNNNNRGHGFLLMSSFEVKVILHVTRHAFKKFKKMNDEYFKRHSMFTRLVHYKPRVLQIFKDTFQSKSEEIIASNIVCGELKELIVEKIERGLPVYIQREVIVHFGHAKHTLMSNVLSDLAKKGDFDKFASYIRNHKEFILTWLTKNINEIFFFEKKEDNGLSLCAGYMVDELKTLTEKVKKCVEFTTEETEIENWIQLFCSKLGAEKLAILSTSFQHVKRYKIKNSLDFCKYITDNLSEIENELKKLFRNVKPSVIRMEGKSLYEEILNALWGCTEECPWCHEPCHKGANHMLGSDNHTCIQHRPVGVGGIVKIGSGTLVNKTCNFQVQSTTKIKCGNWCGCSSSVEEDVWHPYKEYKKYIPSWDIPPITVMDSPKFWNWFMSQYRQDLAKYYNAELPIIPSSWENVSRDEAIESLSKSES